MTVQAMRPRQEHPSISATPGEHDRTSDARVEMVPHGALIEHLEITDPTVVMLLDTAPDTERPAVATRMITVGAQGMASMGLGIDLSAIDDRVSSVLDTVTSEAETTVRDILETSRRSLGEQFDPDQRTSIIARAMADFTEWRDGFLQRLDPTVEGSTATELVQRLQQLVGPGGVMDLRLKEALDLDGGDSSLAHLRRTIETGFGELRRDLAADRAATTARTEEAERGTAHGLEFEDVVEMHLRTWAAGARGCIVERTATTTGALNALSKVGDFVVTLADGRRVVVEAKRQGAIGLTGSGGILAELDQAMVNRSADIALCIAGRDSFPVEVGRFNVYGKRILAVDEGDGTMIAVAMQWAAATAGAPTDRSLDIAAIAERVERIRHAAEQLSGARRAVTTIKSSLDKLHEQLGTLRGDILDQVDDLTRVVASPSEPNPSN
jgi:hypothetical protein